MFVILIKKKLVFWEIMYIFGAHTQYLIFNELKKEIIFKFLNLFAWELEINFFNSIEKIKWRAFRIKEIPYCIQLYYVNF